MVFPSPFLRAGVLVLAAAFAVGCDPAGGPSEMSRLRTQVEAQRERIARLEEDAIATGKTIDEQKQQIATLQQLGPDRLQQLVYPEKIEFDRLTGGFDEDGQPGDDGVVAYVRPLDRDGHVVKAAGSLRMQVFDLASPPERSLVASAELDAEHARKAWYGRLWTNHFTIRCPWQPPERKPPAHRELTVKVEFTDLLTGETLSAQQVVQIKLPGEAATQPAR